ncbi:MAG: KH domain-containing protein [Elusimicrobiaceae bacterium]|nr:KH domain-containing protein [Elusimicrobiaceae bacterium]
MKELASYLLKSLAQNKDAVIIDAKEEGNNVYLTVRVDEADKGRVIGKEGCIIKAVRTVLGAYAAKEKKKVTLKLED